MAFEQYAAAGLRSGKTTALVLNMLPGWRDADGKMQYPVVHVEHLGETNQTFWNDQIARANSREAIAAVMAKPGKITKKVLSARRKKDREALAAHAVRRLEARHKDGTPATAADIPDFMEAIPDDVVDVIRDFAMDPENFREAASDDADPEETAGK